MDADRFGPFFRVQLSIYHNDFTRIYGGANRREFANCGQICGNDTRYI